MLVVLSLLLKLAGVGFLCVAGLGVVRLSDPFQRMHAATKAGTLGAGLVILGTIVAQGATDATIIGVLTILFLLLTVPVAGHLLGRAAYVSGAKLSLRGDNALDGILERSARPLDERTGWLPAEQTSRQGAEPSIVARQQRPVIVSLPQLEAVRFAVIDGHVEPVAGRVANIAKVNSVELCAHVVVDTHAVDTAEDPAQMRRLVRERASRAIHVLRGIENLDSALDYDEGDPETLLACDRTGEVLLVLPCEGWFHHQVDGRRNLASWEPDGLLRLPGVHLGPVLFAGAGSGAGMVVIRDRGEGHLAALVEWALMAQVWQPSSLVHVADQGVDRRGVEGIARRFGLPYESRPGVDEDCTIPHELAGACAVILGRTPRPLRTNWFGAHWRTRIAPGMSGDVLVMEPPQDRSGA